MFLHIFFCTSIGIRTQDPQFRRYAYALCPLRDSNPACIFRRDKFYATELRGQDCCSIQLSYRCISNSFAKV